MMGIAFVCIMFTSLEPSLAQIYPNTYLPESNRSSSSTWDYSTPYSSQGNSNSHSMWDYSNPYSSQGNSSSYSTWDYSNPYSSQGNSSSYSTWDYSNPYSSQGNSSSYSTWDYSNPYSSQGNNSSYSTWDYSNPYSSRDNSTTYSMWDYTNPEIAQNNSNSYSTWDYSNPYSSQGNSSPTNSYSSTPFTPPVIIDDILLHSLELEASLYESDIKKAKRLVEHWKFAIEHIDGGGIGIWDLRNWPEKRADVLNGFHRNLEESLLKLGNSYEQATRVYEEINETFGPEIENQIRMSINERLKYYRF